MTQPHTDAGSQQVAVGLRDAMAMFPSGVTIVTTRDYQGDWWGFTATSFCALSADPPLVLVCLARTAECFPTFMGVSNWVINVVPPTYSELAVLFATRGADKFGGGHFAENSKWLPVLNVASVVLECEAHARHDGGDHVILVGRVTAARLREETPAVYFNRRFHSLGVADAG